MSDAIFLAQIHIPIVLPILVSDMRTWSLLDISSFLSYLAHRMNLFTSAFLAQAIFASPFKVDIPVSFRARSLIKKILGLLRPTQFDV